VASPRKNIFIIAEEAYRVYAMCAIFVEVEDKQAVSRFGAACCQRSQVPFPLPFSSGRWFTHPLSGMAHMPVPPYTTISIPGHIYIGAIYIAGNAHK